MAFSRKTVFSLEKSLGRKKSVGTCSKISQLWYFPDSHLTDILLVTHYPKLFIGNLFLLFLFKKWFV